MRRYKDTPYFITEDGQVYRKGKKLKLYKDKDGYLKVTLSIYNAPDNKSVHRLVAETFIPKPNEKSFIRHINGDNSDNRVENLKWVKIKNK